MSGKQEKAARRAVRRVLPALEQTFETRAVKDCPAGFWRRVHWFFDRKLKAKDQHDWEANRTASKELYLKRGQKKLAKVYRQGRRLGLT